MKDRLSNYPEEVVKSLAELLRAYDVAYIIKDLNTNEYSATTGIALTSEPSVKVVERVEAKEYFSKKERQLNYINSFFDYPSDYSGVRCYPFLAEVSQWSGEERSHIEFVFDSFDNIIPVNRFTGEPFGFSIEYVPNIVIL